MFCAILQILTKALVNWQLFSRVIRSFLVALNHILRNVLSVWDPSTAELVPLPSVDFGDETDATYVFHNVDPFMSP